ncbi:hypothetical protein B7494_g1963 [Chlorociboria aeruginascens]|nr:hypothetical protein B7494_g1963 [Chlorociboria aeruginascens]
MDHASTPIPVLFWKISKALISATNLDISQMALSRKYAALPDLDSAPDIYETPELTDDNSTAPRGRANSQSTSSSYKDFDDDEDDTPGISRSRLHPDEARSHFSPSQIDARDVDFSDRVTAKRKSYKVSTRRQRQREDGVEEYGDFSDEEEGFERKLARLRREIEEVKEEYSKRKSEEKDVKLEKEADGEGIVALSKILDGISLSQGEQATSAQSKLAKDLGAGISANGPKAQNSGEPATYTVTYAPTYQQNHALAKAADFDGRLSILEKLLGLNSLNVDGVPTAILPTLDTLSRQLSILSDSTPSSLDSISRRVRTLTQEAERLEDAQKAAKTAQDALKAAGGEVASEDGEDSEQVAKINALYGTLSTIENLSPLLPPLLDRLRSLRAIHADAATASESLEKVEKRQADMAVEIKKWSEGLEKVEEAMKRSETVVGGNMKVVEGWHIFPSAFCDKESKLTRQVPTARYSPADCNQIPRVKHGSEERAGIEKRDGDVFRAAAREGDDGGYEDGFVDIFSAGATIYVGLYSVSTCPGPYQIPHLTRLGSWSTFGAHNGTCGGRDSRPLEIRWAKEIVGHFVLAGEFRDTCTIYLAVLAIYAVDFAINAVQWSCRSLISDTLPVHKQQAGSSWASRMAALGHLIGYVIGTFDLVSIFGPSMGNTQFKQLILVAAFALLFAVGITSWAVTERVLISSKDANSPIHILKIFRQIIRTTMTLPPRIQAICWAQFWSWIGWFPFLFYSTTWVGETYFRYDAPNDVKDSKDALGEIGRIGSMALVLFSAVSFVGAFLLPLFVKSPEEEMFTHRPPASIAGIVSKVNKYKPDLLSAWFIGHLMFSAAMVLAPFAHSFRFATSLVGFCGLSWAVASWAPFAFIGIEVNRLSSPPRYTPTSATSLSSQRPLSPSNVEKGGGLSPFSPSALENHSSTGELSGIYFGILNIYTTIPQFIGTMLSMLIFSILEPGKSPELAGDVEGVDKVAEKGGPNAIAVCLCIGAISTCGAAFATKRLRALQ